MPVSGARRLRSTSTASALSGLTYTTRQRRRGRPAAARRPAGPATTGTRPGSCPTRSGATTSACWPALIAVPGAGLGRRGRGERGGEPLPGRRAEPPQRGFVRRHAPHSARGVGTCPWLAPRGRSPAGAGRAGEPREVTGDRRGDSGVRLGCTAASRSGTTPAQWGSARSGGSSRRRAGADLDRDLPQRQRQHCGLCQLDPGGWPAVPGPARAGFVDEGGQHPPLQVARRGPAGPGRARSPTVVDAVVNLRAA